MSENLSRPEVLALLLKVALTTAASVLMAYYVVEMMDPTRIQKKKAQKKVSDFPMLKSYSQL